MSCPMFEKNINNIRFTTERSMELNKNESKVFMMGIRCSSIPIFLIKEHGHDVAAGKFLLANYLKSINPDFNPTIQFKRGGVHTNEENGWAHERYLIFRIVPRDEDEKLMMALVL